MKKINKTLRTQLFQILFWQLLIITGLAFVLFLLQGIHKGLSAFSGGLAYWLPTSVFMWRVSAYAGAQAALKFILAFFSGEIVKLFLSGVLFLLIVKYLNIDVMYGVLGLIGGIVAFWVASVATLYHQGAKS